MNTALKVANGDQPASISAGNPAKRSTVMKADGIANQTTDCGSDMGESARSIGSRSE